MDQIADVSSTCPRGWRLWRVSRRQTCRSGLEGKREWSGQGQTPASPLQLPLARCHWRVSGPWWFLSGPGLERHLHGQDCITTKATDERPRRGLDLPTMFSDDMSTCQCRSIEKRLRRWRCISFGCISLFLNLWWWCPWCRCSVTVACGNSMYTNGGAAPQLLGGSLGCPFPLNHSVNSELRRGGGQAAVEAIPSGRGG